MAGDEFAADELIELLAEHSDRLAALVTLVAFLLAPPVKIFPILEPPSLSSPCSVAARPSRTLESAGRLETSSRPSSRSYQRKAGMLALLPHRIPAWPLDVIDGTSHSQPPRRWLPAR